MADKTIPDISLNGAKAMLPHERSAEQAAVRAVAALSQEDRNLLAAVQESPYRLTTRSSFGNFPPISSTSFWSPMSDKVEDAGMALSGAAH